jgi:hypothetical protein
VVLAASCGFSTVRSVSDKRQASSAHGLAAGWMLQLLDSQTVAANILNAWRFGLHAGTMHWAAVHCKASCSYSLCQRAVSTIEVSICACGSLHGPIRGICCVHAWGMAAWALMYRNRRYAAPEKSVSHMLCCVTVPCQVVAHSWHELQVKSYRIKQKPPRLPRL